MSVPTKGAGLPAPLTFPEPSRAAWLEQVAASLKGAPFESLRSTTPDGITIEPLYRAEDAPAPLAARPLPRPDAERPWDLRTVVDHADPAQAADQAREDLEAGAASLLLRLDPAGRDGVIVYDQDSLARALSGVLLEAAPVALDAGFASAEAANWLAVAAKGAPTAELGFHMDPLSAAAEAGESPSLLGAIVDACAQTAARHAPAYPRATHFLASGRVVHEAGGSDGQELGFMAASALAYAKAGVAAGLSMDTAFAGVVLGSSVDQAYLESLAKLRAARAIWARLTNACGVDLPARIEARSSRRMLSKADAWTNLLRLTTAGFAAGAGGADTVILEPFTRPIGPPAALARRQARNIQLVLMQEAHLGRVADPAGGAWYLESLTDALARAGWAFLQAIESKGGTAAAIESGFVAEAVAQARAERKARPIVGASDFRDPDPKPVPVEPAKPAAARPPGPAASFKPLSPIRFSEPFEAADPS